MRFPLNVMHYELKQDQIQKNVNTGDIPNHWMGQPQNSVTKQKWMW